MKKPCSALLLAALLVACGSHAPKTVKLVGNPKFPHLVDEARETFRRMRALAPDIYLTMHPAAWPKVLDENEAAFEAQLKSQRTEYR